MSSLVKSSRPKITIDISGQESGIVPSYSTWDRINGIATIEADRDTGFDEIGITLEGTVKTSVDRVSVPGRAEASHELLRIRHTVNDVDYPVPRILRGGQAYRFPFTFIVPDRLSQRVCNHDKVDAGAEPMHTSLPPSLGDPMIASSDGSLLDDMCPDMCQVSYVVRVDIHRPPSADKHPIVTSAAKKIRIIPAVEEAPPLDIPDHGQTYWNYKEKDIKRGVMRAKLGRITATASQPKCISLFPPDCREGDSVGTVATLLLRFDPAGDESPPRLNILNSKLRVSTSYADHAMSEHPSLTEKMLQPGCAAYIEQVPLSSRCVASASWTKHHAPRRNSTESKASCESDSSLDIAGFSYYTLQIIVPITLPKNKVFVPTFDSCLVSRFYALDLSISYRTPNTSIFSQSISLRLPIQLACQQRIGNGIYSPPLEDLKDDIERVFAARNVAPPCPEYTEFARPSGNAL